jgi:hypothetical protein
VCHFRRLKIASVMHEINPFLQALLAQGVLNKDPTVWLTRASLLIPVSCHPLGGLHEITPNIPNPHFDA